MNESRLKQLLAILVDERDMAVDHIDGDTVYYRATLQARMRLAKIMPDSNIRRVLYDLGDKPFTLAEFEERMRVERQRG